MITVRKQTKSLTAKALCLLACTGIPASAALDNFPEERPLSGAAAAHALAKERRCLTPEMDLAVAELRRGPRRGRAWLERRPLFKQAGAVRTVRGLSIEFTRQAAAQFGSLPTAVQQRRLDQLARGLLDARHTLERRLGLDVAPLSPELLLADLGPEIEGYYLPTKGRQPGTIVISLESSESDLDRIVAHQLAHAIATELGLPRHWAEGLAIWTELQLPRRAEPRLLKELNRRLSSLQDGFIGVEPRDASSIAAWLAFSAAKWGDASVGQTLLELIEIDAADSEAATMDALRRTAQQHGTSLAQAFADFHLWTLFTGSRDDGKHLSFASQLQEPSFASDANGLPALSIQSDPALMPWGATRVRLLNSPTESAQRDGGLHIVFEGEFSARWALDLILTGTAGEIHRLPLELVDGRVETIVPLESLQEAVLLVRRLGGQIDGEAAALPYSYSAARESDWPFELAEIAVEINGPDRLVQWETLTEQDVVGFNLLRRSHDSEIFTQVNPVWIPAIGRSDQGVGYRFLDRDADPEQRYEYRVQAITSSGMTSHSKTVTVAPRN